MQKKGNKGEWALPRRERERLDQSEEEERGGNEKKGERRIRDPYAGDPTQSAPINNSDEFSPFFPANCFKKPLRNSSMTFPLHVSPQKSRNLVVVWWRTHPWVPRLLCLKSINRETISFNYHYQNTPLEPRNKSQALVGASELFWFEHIHIKVSEQFWWNLDLSRPNWPWSQVWKLLYSWRSSFLQHLVIFGDSWILRRVEAADRHPQRCVASGASILFLGYVWRLKVSFDNRIT